MKPLPKPPLVGRYLEEVWAKAQNRDRDALELLAERITSQVRHRSRRLVNRSELDDLVQEVELSVLNNLQNEEKPFACPRNFARFIDHRAQAKATVIQRRRPRAPQEPLHSQIQLKDPSQLPVWTQMEELEERAALLACIEALPIELKTCIHERYFGEHTSGREVSKKISCSHTTVNRRLEAAQQKLSTCLDAKGVGE